MNIDFRISTTALSHPKLVKLRRRLGADAVLSLFALWAWTARERPDGVLHGLDAEDIAIAAGWMGNEIEFVNALVGLHLLDAGETGFAVHGWAEHNTPHPWAAGAQGRSEKARKAAEKRWKSVTPMLNHAQAMPEQCSGNARASAEHCSSHAQALPEQCLQHHSGVVLCNNTTTPNPSSTERPEPATVECGVVVDRGGGDAKIETREGVEVLEYPASLSHYERQQVETLVQPYPAQAQSLLDELEAAIQSHKVKASPVAYLRGLVKRATAGTFTPEAGIRIARERERRRQAENAVKAALVRPPTAGDPNPIRCRPEPIRVAEHIAALKATLDKRTAQTNAVEPAPQRNAA